MRITCYYTRALCPENPRWSGPALNIANHTRITYERGTVSVLIIDPVQEEDEGQYHCSCGQTDSRPSSLSVFRKLLATNVNLITGICYH